MPNPRPTHSITLLRDYPEQQLYKGDQVVLYGRTSLTLRERPTADLPAEVREALEALESATAVASQALSRQAQSLQLRAGTVH